jgi:thiamine transport system ATP-binding protein
MLQLTDITVRFDDRVVLDDVSLDVTDGEIVAVLGPSGCGKSTLLRVIAGLLRPDAGTVSWDGTDITDLPPHQRQIGLVFQDNLLFPHLDVAGNVAFGLRMAGWSRRDIAERIRTLLGLVGLPGYERRKVATLSGGEAQRVALARALAPRPRVLLLDEPFGALDRELHDRLVTDVHALLHELGTTTILVTHDRSEAETMTSRLIEISPRAPT